MSLWSSLLETYEKCSTAAGIVPLGKDGNPDEKKAFLPLFHTTFKSKICVTLDSKGNLLKIEEDSKDITITIPCTEKSMSRSGKAIAPHPLFDELGYLDKNISEIKYTKYMKQLNDWKDKDIKLNAIHKFLTSNSILEVLQFDIEKIHAIKNALLIPDKNRDKQKKELFQETKKGVRFIVEINGDLTPNVWEDISIRNLWIQKNYKSTQQSGTDYFGEPIYELTINHPKKIFRGASGAKLISCNTEYGLRYTGRFERQDDAIRIDTITSQKIHTTLTWLVNSNGSSIDSQVLVVWAVDADTEEKIVPFENSFDLFGELESRQTDNDIIAKAQADTNTNYAIKFNNLLKGYGKADNIKQHSRTIVIAIFDAATTGRMGVTFYRELPENEYLENIAKWHEQSAWFLTRFEKYIETKKNGKQEEKARPIQYIGAPSFSDIIECVYKPTDKSSDNYKKLARSVRKQLIECMFGNFSFPFSMVKMACDKVSRPASYDDENKWRRNFEVACSLAKKYYIQKGDEVNMSLDTTRTDRDYLYGRLLALADNLESYALFKQGISGSRSTNAVKLMSNFAVKPYSTWGNLWQQLVPYINYFHGAAWFQNQIDEVKDLFKKGDFENNSPLSPLYLLGYSAQRRELSKYKENKKTDSSEKVKENDYVNITE